MNCFRTKSHKSRNILICGDVNGHWESLFHRVNEVNSQSGPFELLLVTGSFFPLDNNEALTEKIVPPPAAPISTIILGPVTQFQLQFYKNIMNGGTIAENIIYLGPSGIYTTENGLTIAHLNGIEFNGPSDYCPPWCFNYKDVADFKTQVEQKNLSKGDVDILLTYPLPYGPDYYNVYDVEPVSSSTLVSLLSRILVPSFHFAAGGQGIYYETKNPFFGKCGELTKFVSLSKAGYAEGEYLYELKFLLRKKQIKNPGAKNWGTFVGSLSDICDEPNNLSTTNNKKPESSIETLGHESNSIPLAPFQLSCPPFKDHRPYVKLGSKLLMLKEEYDLRLVFDPMPSELTLSFMMETVFEIVDLKQSLRKLEQSVDPLDKKNVEDYRKLIGEKEACLLQYRAKVFDWLTVNKIEHEKFKFFSNADIILPRVDFSQIQMLADFDWDEEMHLKSEMPGHGNGNDVVPFEIYNKIKVESNYTKNYWKPLRNWVKDEYTGMGSIAGNVAILDSGREMWNTRTDPARVHPLMFDPRNPSEWIRLEDLHSDLTKHGTATSDIIISGSPPGVTSYIFKAGRTQYDFRHSEVVRCFEKIIPYENERENILRRIKIVNCSFSYTNPSAGFKAEMLECLNKCKRHGIIVIFGAGNEGQATPEYYANSEDVISVGSFWSKSATLCEFSSGKFNVDILAPPISNLKFPRQVQELDAGIYKTANAIIPLFGTSFSAPRVTVGLLYANHILYEKTKLTLDLDSAKAILGLSLIEVKGFNGEIQKKGFDPATLRRGTLAYISTVQQPHDGSQQGIDNCSSGYCSEDDETFFKIISK